MIVRSTEEPVPLAIQPVLDALNEVRFGVFPSEKEKRYAQRSAVQRVMGTMSADNLRLVLSRPGLRKDDVPIQELPKEEGIQQYIDFALPEVV